MSLFDTKKPVPRCDLNVRKRCGGCKQRGEWWTHASLRQMVSTPNPPAASILRTYRKDTGTAIGNSAQSQLVRPKLSHHKFAILNEIRSSNTRNDLQLIGDTAEEVSRITKNSLSCNVRVW